MKVFLDWEICWVQFPFVKVKRVTVVFVLLPLLLFFGGTCVFIWNVTKLDPPKEAMVIRNFNEHRAAFEKLRDMLLPDTNLSRVAVWGIDRNKPFFLGYPTEQDFPLDRFHKYLVLIKEAGGGVAVRGEGPHAYAGIIVWGWGFAGNTHHIGVCWLDETPTNLISTMDGYRSHSEDSVAYRHIESNWYISTDL